MYSLGQAQPVYPPPPDAQIPECPAGMVWNPEKMTCMNISGPVRGPAEGRFPWGMVGLVVALLLLLNRRR
jgi:hypothetical protein